MSVTLHGPDDTPPRPPAPAAPPPQQTPTQRILAEATQVRYVTDARGRSLGYRRFNFVERMRITKAMGRDATNDQLMLFVEVAACVRSIDGNPVPFPANYNLVEALAAQLDNDGSEAILGAWVKDEQERQDAGQQSGIEYAKNSQGTAG